MTKKNKTFDALDMSRKLRIETGRLLASMTPPQQMEFLNRNIAHYPNARAQTGKTGSASKS